MSRNNKNRRLKAIAASFTALRKQGQKGPARTKKLHNKVNTWYRDPKRRGQAVTLVSSDTPIEQLIASNDEAVAA